MKESANRGTIPHYSRVFGQAFGRAFGKAFGWVFGQTLEAAGIGEGWVGRDGGIEGQGVCKLQL